MSPRIRTAVHAGLHLSEKELDELEAACPIRLPDPDFGRRTPIALYEEVLGRAAIQRTSAAPSVPGTTEHAFILPSWPHMFWIVREGPNGDTFSAGFENQYAAAARCLKPQLIRPELVTLDLIKQVAREWKFYDGWDEDVTVHFSFPEGTFEGRFVWGLLQEWQPFPTSSQSNTSSQS